MVRLPVFVALLMPAIASGGELAPTPKPLHSLPAHNIGSNWVRFTPDGKLLVSDPAVHGERLVWNVATAKPMKQVKVPDAIGPDGKFGAWIIPRRGLDRTGVIAVTEVAGDKELYRIADTSKDSSHTDPGNPHFSPDGKTLYYFYHNSVGYGSESWLRAVDAATGKDKREIVAPHYKGMCPLRFSFDGKRFATSYGPDALVFDTATGKELAKFQAYKKVNSAEGHRKDVARVAWSPDGTILAAGSNDDIIRLWEVAQGRMLHALKGHTARITGLEFAADGKHLISASLDETLRVWDVSTGEQRTAYKPLTPTVTPDDVVNGRGIRSIGLSPDGKLLAVGGYDRTVKVWEVPALIPKAP